jgi:hypothetical protein
MHQSEVHQHLRRCRHHRHRGGEDALHQPIPVSDAARRVGALVGVRRAGEQQDGLLAGHQRTDHGRVARIATGQAVRTECPDVAGARYRVRGCLGNVVSRIGLVGGLLVVAVAGGLVVTQQARNLLVVEARQRQIEVGQLQVFEFERQQRLIPLRPGSGSVGQQTEGLDLRIRQLVGQDDRHRRQPKLARRLEAQMAIDQFAGALGHHRNPKSELGDDRGHLLHGVVVLARIPGVVDQSVDRPLLQLQFGWGQGLPLEMETARTGEVTGRKGR